MFLINVQNSRKLKLFLLSFVVIALCVVVAVFVGYRRVLNKHDDIIASIKGKAVLSLANLHQTATRDGITEWSLNAGSAHYIEEDKKAVLQDLSVIFFLKDNDKVKLTAEKGLLKTASNDIEVQGNVVLKNKSYLLKTDKLFYRHKVRILFSKDPVKITGESSTLRADSISYNLTTNKAMLKGNVEGLFSGQFSL